MAAGNQGRIPVANWHYTKGLHEIGNGCWAYLQPDGGWGWSNAGLIVDGDETLLVDTLFDLPLTAEMLKTMADAVPAAKRIDTLLNTHINGDHTFGNQLVEGAKILTTKIVDHAMPEEGAERIQEVLANWEAYGEGGRFMKEVFAPFNFAGIQLPPTTETFVGSMELKVGDKTVQLHDLGPAHTASDTLVYIPEDKTVYTGDLLFVGGHPAIWAGPVSNWIKACETILSWDVETVIPGHGPIATKHEVREFRDYLQFLTDEARKRYDAGMGFEEAAHDIDFGRFDSWGDGERTAANMITLWGEFSGKRPEVPFEEIWNMMARLAAKRKARHAHADCGHPGHNH